MESKMALVQHWGYFQRRMTLSRAQDVNLGREMPSMPTDTPQVTESPYGKSLKPWRFFESVPNKLSSMRSKEAAEVANRHLR